MECQYLDPRISNLVFWLTNDSLSKRKSEVYERVGAIVHSMTEYPERVRLLGPLISLAAKTMVQEDSTSELADWVATRIRFNSGQDLLSSWLQVYCARGEDALLQSIADGSVMSECAHEWACAGGF